MDVKLGRLLVIQEDARVMVKLDNDNRALNAIVKWILISEAADPAKVGLVVERLNLRQPNGSRALR